MKKTLLVPIALLLIVAVCLMTTACGKSADNAAANGETPVSEAAVSFIGDWETESYERGELPDEADLSVQLTINDDKTFTMVQTLTFVFDDNSGDYISVNTITGDYTEDGDTLNCAAKHSVVKMTVDSEEKEPTEKDEDFTFTAERKDGKLIVVLPSKITITMVKK